MSDHPAVPNSAPSRAPARTEQPIYFSPAMNLWVVTRYDYILAVLRDQRRFSSAQAYQAMLDVLTLSPEGLQAANDPVPLDTLQMAGADQPEHTRLRSSVHRIFTPQRLAVFEPRIRHIAHQVIDRFADDHSADLVKQFSYLLPLQVILHIIGIPEGDMAQFKRWCEDWAALMFTRPTDERQIACARSLSALNQYLVDLIADRQNQPQHDLASYLVQAGNSGEARLNTAEMVYLLSHLIGAAHETTASALNACFYYLLKDRRHWQAIQNDPTLIPQVVEEALRCDLAVRGPIRTTTEEVTLGDVTLPQGARVYLALTVANRDKAQFTEPQIFDPQQDDRQKHLAFGHGIHHCLGAPLARLELRIALEVVSARLPGLRLSTKQQIRVTRNAMMAMQTFECIPVEWDTA